MKFRLSLLVFLIPHFCFSETAYNPSPFLKDFVTHYQKLHTFSELVEQAPLPIEPYKFLKMKVKGFEKMALPKLRLLKDSVQFDSQGTVVTLQVISPTKFKLNQRTIDISNTKSTQEIWDMVEAALPKPKSALWQIFLPDVHASPDPITVTIAILGLVVAIASFAVSGFNSYVTVSNSDQGICQDNKVALDDCTIQLQHIGTYVRVETTQVENDKHGFPPVVKSPTSSEQLKKAKASIENWKQVIHKVEQGSCTVEAPEPALDAETARVVSRVWRTQENKIPRWSCPVDKDGKSDKEKLVTCIEGIGEAAASTCMHLTITAVEAITKIKVKPNVAIPKQGLVPQANPQAPPPEPVKPEPVTIKAEVVE